MDEFGLIRQYFQHGFNNSLDITGGNDDCAAIIHPAGTVQHLSIDTMVTGVHFFDDMNPADIGHRALATAVSDLAAAGAKPCWFSLALSLPSLDQPWLKAFSEGLKSLATQLDIQLIGGDTTRGALTITVQVAGTTDGSAQLLRSGAQLGDLVAVTGFLGDAAGGVAQWHESHKDTQLATAYCRPLPQIATGQQLYGHATSCIDISDGLIADANHIAKASRCQLNLDCQCLPVSRALIQAFGRAQAMQMALSGGDDYQLLFTVPQTKRDWLAHVCPGATIIGSVSAGEGVSLIHSEGIPNPKKLGFNHFDS